MSMVQVVELAHCGVDPTCRCWVRTSGSTGREGTTAPQGTASQGGPEATRQVQNQMQSHRQALAWPHV
jgi:hypothetical protein